MSTRIIAIALFLVCAITGAHASPPPRVENVSFYEAAGAVVVTYDLKGEPGKNYQVNLAFSDDGGYTYKIKPKRMAGHVGKDIPTGPGHRILWHLTQDYAQGLSGDRFVCRVEAYRPGKVWPWLAGAALAGGAGTAAYLLTRPEDEPSTGTLVITIPDHP